MKFEEILGAKESEFAKLNLKPNEKIELMQDEQRQLAFKLKGSGFSPLKLDLESEYARQRQFFKKHSFYQENLARALGLKRGQDKKVIVDLTLGMGKDAIMMLAMGLWVESWERNPWVYLLHLNYRELNPKPLWEDRWQVHFGQAPLLFRDAIFYFDPMYDEINSKAAPKKNMRIFRDAFPADQDASDVVERLLSLKLPRLVVKRPIKASPLNENFHHQVKGKSTRFDIYL